MLVWVWLSSYVSDKGGDDDTVGINIAGNDWCISNCFQYQLISEQQHYVMCVDLVPC